MSDLKNTPFIFIVGRSRSGTTLLQNILDANNKVVLPFESRLILYLKTRYSKVESWTDQKIDLLIVDLNKDYFFREMWQVDVESLRKTLKQYPKEELNFSVVCKLIYLSYPTSIEKKTISLIGDKNPIYSIFLPDLLGIFPDAKFIHLIRDYRDNVVSNIDAFGPLYKVSSGLLGVEWLIQNLKIEEVKNQIPNQFYTLKYEELVKNPNEKVQEICDFLNIKFTLDMINFHQKIKPTLEELKIDISKTVHKNLIKPINKDQIKKWENRFKVRELEFLDFVCGTYALNYGYEPTSKKINFLFRLKYFWLKMKCRKNYMFIRKYYNSPIQLRDFSRFVSLILFKLFKIRSFYNKDEL